MQKPCVMIFEPRLGGHHLTWLRYVTEDCLAGGFSPCLAVDLRPGPREKICQHLHDLQGEISMISAYDSGGAHLGGSKTRALEHCFQESGASQILMTNFDELASLWLRKAAFGMNPPTELRGRLNCIYFRPRFLANRWWPVGNVIKSVGFKRLCRMGWFRNLYFLDEYLCARAQEDYSGVSSHFLPDPWSGNFSQDKSKARQILGVPPKAKVFLHYGLGTRRKGLHLTIEAMGHCKIKEGFLLCAGKLDDDQYLLDGLAALTKKGQALVLDRYVTHKEEELCFAATDVVLLPYEGHFGSSAVLSRAAAAGRIVVSTNEGLLGRRVVDHRLGLVFESGQMIPLAKAMETVLDLSEKTKATYQQAAWRYADGCTREAFRNVLLRSL